METGNNKRHLLIENLPDAFAYHQIVTNIKGKPVDYIFLDVNKAFEKMTGLRRDKIIGKKVTEVHQGIENLSFDWIDTYGNVALSGEGNSFEQYFEIAERWYTITTYSEEPGYFVAIFRDITESKKTEQALRESEAKYRDLVENINEVIYILDENGAITYVSPSVEVISGYTPSELTKMRFTDFVHPDDLEGRMEQFFKIMSGINEASEYRFITKDGRVAWVRTAARPVVRDGRVVGVKGVLSDITERKEAEEKLRLREERFQKMLSLVPDMISVHDPDMNILYSNWNGFGAVPEEKRILNTKCYRAYRGFDDICPDCQAVTVLQTGKAFQKDVELPEGTWVDLHVIPILDNDNKVELFVEWVRDITETKHSEQELKTQQKLLEGIIDGVSDILSIKHPDLSIERYNQAGYDLYGMTPEEMKGKKCYELIGHERECEVCATRKAVQTKKLVQIEKFEPELGAYLDCRSNPILDENGNVTQVVEQFRDITERKEKERQIQESENLLSAIIDNAKDFIFVKDTSLRYIKINKAMTFLFELPQEKILGMSDSDLFGPEFAEHIESVDRQVLEGETVEEFPTKPAGSEMRYFHTIKVPLKDGYGNIVGLCGIARDITNHKQAEESLRYHYEFEKMVSETASYFVNLQADQVDEGINYALKECGNFFQVERSYIFLLSPDGKSLSMTHEWHKKEIEPQINRLQGISIGKRPWWHAQVTEKGYVYIPDVSDMPVEAEVERNEFLKQKIKSLLSIPMITGGKIIGYLGLDAIKDKKTWTEEHINLLTVLAELISNALDRQWSDEKIRSLSFHDQLTGLYNRHMLNEEMLRIDTDRQLPISIIMTDLNGLKLVNDTYGHMVGDEMLICTANILKYSCRKEDIIARWGGDEFVILLPQTIITEAQRIEKRIKGRCRDAYVNDMPVSITLGLSVKENMEKDLILVLKEAEDNMYKQKLVESQSAKSAVLKTLRKALEEKSFETEEHTRNMQKTALKIANKINLPDSEINRLSLLITLHDIGKINIAEDILTKTEPLTPGEWELMKKHPETGYRIALAAEEFAHVAGDILAHHERWDGSGYPQGLKGKEISLLSRITAIADAYEVMSRGRPYKKALTPEQIKAELKRCAGTQFDPELVKVFLSVLEA